jgi:phospholipase C
MRSIVRNNVVRTTFVLCALGAATLAAAQAGCSGEGAVPGGPSSDPSSQPAGTVGMQLTLPGGEQLTSVSWTITGPNGSPTVVTSGTTPVGNSQTISFQIGGIPAGNNYTIALSGTTTDGSVTCAGSAPFNVTARTTTNVAVALQCASAAGEAGSILINGGTFNCGTVTSVSAVPAEAIVGSSVAVSASAVAPNTGALSYSWSAPSGTFDTPGSANASFTCTQAGPVTLTVSVTDGAVPSGSACSAASTSTVQVTCDGHLDQAAAFATTTKIKHLIVIFNENNSFDHYFGTYPNAQNNAGETVFTSAPGTPVPNNLVGPLNVSEGFAPITGVNLLTSNPTASASGNGTNAINPFRLGKQYAETSSQNHNYMPEQQADDNGKMDLYPEFTGTAGPPPPADAGAPPQTQTAGIVMAYYDGNTLNTYWSWAQQYAVNDNMWTTNFGPSTPGAVNVISGQTDGVVGTVAKPASGFSTSHATPDGNGGFALIGDIEPLGDKCSSASKDNGSMSGLNIGNLLNGRNVTWGWFNGGFNLGLTNAATNTTGCARSTAQTVPFSTTTADYVPHHQPFQYYPSTANLNHNPPSSTAAVGHSLESDGVTPEPANHQYDTVDFFAALSAGNLPAVVYLKAPAFQDGHPGNSNPVDEQSFAASVVSALQATQEWASSAVVITYDDSDGWYDHQAPPIVNMSNGVADALNGTGLCNSGAQQGDAGAATTMLNGVAADGGATGPAVGRCAYGTRVPLMVISPFAKRNFVDHTLVDQSSVVRFIEDNWIGGTRIQPGGSFDTVAGPLTNMLTGI